MFCRRILIILIFIAIAARFINLDYIPPHLSNDEIGSAYAAYSISKTLMDGANQFLPILWASPGGYGSPLAVYIPMMSIMILGNNDFAVRLPSAILGSLTIIFIGFLVMELTRNNKLALIVTFILAFSPWHFSASRWALESNYALFFIVLGIYLFFLGLKYNKSWATIVSFISFALSIYSYYTEWVLTPLIIFSLLIFYRKTVLKKKIYYVTIVLFVILLIPLFSDWLHHLNSSRANSEFIVNDINVGRLLSKHPNPLEQGQIILKAIFDKYSIYTSLDNLFFNGARLLPRDNPYQFGFFLSPFLIAFIGGLYKLRTLFNEHSNFIYFLLVVSPLTASVTQGDINNWRSLPQLLPIAIITAAGAFFIWNFIKTNCLMKIFSLGLLLISFLYFIFAYFVHSPIQNADGFQYGYKQMASYISLHYKRYKKIIVDPRFGSKYYYYSGVPSLYIPFYTYLDPRLVQNAKILPQGVSFDKYEFRNIYWDQERIKENYLYIVPFDNTPNPSHHLKDIYEIQLPNRKVKFILYSLL